MTGMSSCLGLPGAPVAVCDLLVTLPSWNHPIHIFEVLYGAVHLCGMGLKASGTSELFINRLFFCFF